MLILVILFEGVVAKLEEQTVIGENTGICLEKEGFLLDRDGGQYRSLFLKVPNPITVSAMCGGLCGTLIRN